MVATRLRWRARDRLRRRPAGARRAGAAELVLLGKTIDAKRALEIGLVNRVSAPGEAIAEARTLASELAALSSVAVRAIKRSLSSGADNDLGAGLDAERALFLEVFHSEDAREGVGAFREKRTPRFVHR